jgi:hypothetical protein
MLPDELFTVSRKSLVSGISATALTPTFATSENESLISPSSSPTNPADSQDPARN